MSTLQSSACVDIDKWHLCITALLITFCLQQWRAASVLKARTLETTADPPHSYRGRAFWNLTVCGPNSQLASAGSSVKCFSVCWLIGLFGVQCSTLLFSLRVKLTQYFNSIKERRLHSLYWLEFVCHSLRRDPRLWLELGESSTSPRAHVPQRPPPVLTFRDHLIMRLFQTFYMLSDQIDQIWIETWVLLWIFFLCFRHMGQTLHRKCSPANEHSLWEQQGITFHCPGDVWLFLNDC